MTSGAPSVAVQQMILYLCFYDEAVSKVAINQILENIYQLTGVVRSESLRIQYDLLTSLLLVPHPQAKQELWNHRLRALLTPESNQSYNFFEVMDPKAEAKTMYAIDFMINLLESYPEACLNFFQHPDQLVRWVWLVRWLQNRVARYHAAPNSELAQRATKLFRFCPAGALEHYDDPAALDSEDGSEESSDEGAPGADAMAETG